MNTRARRFGRLVAEKRKDLKLTQTELGKSLGMGQAAVSNIETGRALPMLSTFLELITILDLDLTECMEILVEQVEARSA